jgi:hypothetical protein
MSWNMVTSYVASKFLADAGFVCDKSPLKVGVLRGTIM